VSVDSERDQQTYRCIVPLRLFQRGTNQGKELGTIIAFKDLGSLVQRNDVINQLACSAETRDLAYSRGDARNDQKDHYDHYN
jgi:hypothetical protein